MKLKIKDNGVHHYVERGDICVFRNHGEKFWWALQVRGGWRILGEKINRSETGIETGRSYPTFPTAEKAMAFAVAFIRRERKSKGVA